MIRHNTGTIAPLSIIRRLTQIIENQAVDVDAVSGATYSSNGIMEAVANAIGVAYDNTNDTNSKGEHRGFKNHK
ncbi:MAG: FMN-binding protein [Velocimicrobium sp.]